MYELNTKHVLMLPATVIVFIQLKKRNMKINSKKYNSFI